MCEIMRMKSLRPSCGAKRKTYRISKEEVRGSEHVELESKAKEGYVKLAWSHCKVVWDDVGSDY